MSFNLYDLSMQAGAVTRQISAENPTGGKGKGAMFEPDESYPFYNHGSKLGKGWKSHPFEQVKAGETITLADINGPGCVNSFFITSSKPNLSELVLRIYWDNEDVPSVESPLGAFFAMGFDFAPHTVYSSMVTVAPHRGLNCYWQMPFRKHAKFTLTNDGEEDARIIAYNVLYKLHDIPAEAAYFHAQYRRSLTSEKNPEHIIVDGIKGKGVYVGTYLAWHPFSTGWWGEGEVKFFLDGDEHPSIVDNGTEDYFGGAWNFGASNYYMDGANNGTINDKASKPEQAFNSPYLGVPLALATNTNGPRKYSMYRWHVYDSIGFMEDFKGTVQSLAWYPDRRYRPSVDDIASVAYWYQLEPHAKFPTLPSVEQRWDK